MKWKKIKAFRNGWLTKDWIVNDQPSVTGEPRSVSKVDLQLDQGPHLRTDRAHESLLRVNSPSHESFSKQDLMDEGIVDQSLGCNLDNKSILCPVVS